MIEVVWLNPYEGGYHTQPFSDESLAKPLLRRLKAKGIPADIKKVKP